MRKIVALLVAVLVATLAGSGCRSARGDASGGALSASAAVQEFLAAAHGGDVRTMSTLFGTSTGSINAREDANDVEKRMRALQCYLTHDSARVLEDVPGMSSARQVTVELRQQRLVRRAAFSVVPGPRRRWFVTSFDAAALADLCHL